MKLKWNRPKYMQLYDKQGKRFWMSQLDVFRILQHFRYVKIFSTDMYDTELNKYCTIIHFKKRHILILPNMGIVPARIAKVMVRNEKAMREYVNGYEPRGEDVLSREYVGRKDGRKRKHYTKL